MSSSKKRLLIMGLAVLCMAAALILLTADSLSCSDSSVVDGDEHDHDHLASESDTVLIDCESDRMEMLTLKNQKGTYNIVRDGDTGQLTIKELDGLPLNTDFIELAWFDVLQISYTSRFAPDDDLASPESLGLTPASAEITLSFKDGTKQGFKVGNALTGESSTSYYTMFDGYSDVFITELNIALFQGDNYWISDDFFDIGKTDNTEITDISIGGTAVGGTVEVKAVDAKEQWEPLYGIKHVIERSGKTYPTDNHNILQLSDELLSMGADEAILARPSNEKKTELGFDTPFLVIKHKRNGKPYTLRIVKHDYDKMYVMVDGIDVVYELIADSYPLIAELDMSKLRSQDVHVRYFETISSMEITSELEGKEFTRSYTLKREEMESGGLYKYWAYCDGAEIELNDMKRVLQSFNTAGAVSFEAFGDDYDEEPVVTVRLKFFDERRKNEEVCYYPLGTRRYACRVNGEGDAVVTEMWLEEFLETAGGKPQ